MAHTTIFTGRLPDPRWPGGGYTGQDAVDITRAEAERRPDGPGACLAPSRALLDPALALRRLTVGRSKSSTEVAALVWQLYRAGYLAEMRASYLCHRPAWTALLQTPEITLLCQCKRPDQCHRSLAAMALAAAGHATYAGER